MQLEDIFGQLTPLDQRLLFAAVYAALDIHAPLDAMAEAGHERLDQLAAFLNEQSYANLPGQAHER